VAAALAAAPVIAEQPQLSIYASPVNMDLHLPQHV
jgi:hypothetical protein